MASDIQTSNTQAPNTQEPAGSSVVLLKANELPAFCPNPKMPLWNHHPRVYLDIAHDGRARCPYCGTQYRLEPGAIVRGH